MVPVGEFPEQTEDEFVVDEAADKRAAIEAEVWEMLSEGIGTWLTEAEADERFAEYREKFNA